MKILKLFLAVMAIFSVGMLLPNTSEAQTKKITWVTGNYADNKFPGSDIGWVTLLQSRGYVVTIDTLTKGTRAVPLRQRQIDTLSLADLIIISRATNSGSYTDTLGWNQNVTKPLISLAPSVVRSSDRLNWFTGSNFDNGKSPVTQILVKTHPIFTGVTVPAGDTLQMLDSTVGFKSTSLLKLSVGKDAGNGQVLAMMKDTSNRCVGIVYWPAGTAFYSASPNKCGGKRMWFDAGTYNNNSAVAGGLMNLTLDGQQIFFNVVEYMITGSVAGVAPAAPQNLAVTDSSSKTITIKWRKNTEADFLRYRIYRDTSPNAATKVDSSTSNPGDTSKTFIGLTNGTKYYLRVTAVNGAGSESAYSNEVSAIPGDYVAPAAPQNLVVTDSSSRTITLKWRKNTEADFLRYRVYRGTSPGPTSQADSTTGGISDTSKTFTGLTNGTRYYFKVTAIDSAGNQSAYSNEVNAVPADRIPPAVPTKLVLVDTSSTRIGIKWNKNTEPDFMRYRIYRATSPNPTTKVDSTTGGVTDTSKTFTGLTNGTRYYLRVTAVDSVGNESLYSNEVSGVPNVTVTVEGLSSQVPTEYMIAQNYPNPFNPSTLIRFGIPVRSSVHLQIYNILGQCIERLVNEELEAGYFEKVWHAGIASGLYFYRIEATAVDNPSKRFVDTKKMLFLK
jgi:fibronectin type 3 domain-containing protein